MLRFIRRCTPALAVHLLLAAFLLASLGCASTPSADTRFQNERSARAHYSVAMEHMRTGRTALAIRELQAAEKIDPEDPWTQIALGEAYRLKGREADAERHLMRALEIEPGLQPARLNLSALYVQTARYDEAIAEAQRLLDDPTFPVPWKALANLGWAQYKLGRMGEARRQLELALEYHPEFWPAALSLAVVDAEQGRRLEAIRGFETVLRLDPGSLAKAEANYRLAEVYISLGNRAKAMQHLSAANTGRSSGEWGRRSQDYLKRLR